MTSFILVRTIENVIHQFIEYLLVIFYIENILSSSNKKKAIAKITREIHLVDSLKINMLIKIDILISKLIIMNINERTLFIESCRNLTVKINAMFRVNLNIRRVVRSRIKVVILSQVLLEILVLIKHRDQLSTDRDLLFKSCYKRDLNQSKDVYAHIVDCNLSFV